MSKTPKIPSAFPLACPERYTFTYPGMDLLDYFAAQALPWCLQHDYGNDWGKSGIKHVPYAAEKAYNIAAAMLAEREKRQAERERQQ